MIPTPEQILNFDGGSSPKAWAGTPSDWWCPACKRTKTETIFMSRSGVPTAQLMRLNKGSRSSRFSPLLVCASCWAAEHHARRLVGAPDSFAFTPEEIGRFIRSVPFQHPHEVSGVVARAIYDEAVAMAAIGSDPEREAAIREKAEGQIRKAVEALNEHPRIRKLDDRGRALVAALVQESRTRFAQQREPGFWLGREAADWKEEWMTSRPLRFGNSWS